MAALRTRPKMGVFKTESTEGVEASSISAASNAFPTIELDVGTNPNVIDDNELRGGLGAGDIVVGATPMTFSARSNLRGAGVAATAPEFADLWESAGWLETVNSTAMPASGATTATAGTTSSVTITVTATTWSATTGALVGQPMELGGDISPAQVVICKSYVVTAGSAVIGFETTFGSSLGTSTTVKRVPHVLYTPHSGTIPSGTGWMYDDGTLTKVFGCRGDWSMDWTAGGKGIVGCRLNGLYGGRTDAALPTSSSMDAITTQPPIWVNGRMNINGVAVAASRFNLALNNAGTFPGNPNATEGLDPYVVTGRSVQGGVNPLMTLVATRDLFADLRAQTVRAVSAILGARSGGATGNRFGVLVLNAKFRGWSMEDDAGIARENVPFQCQGVNNEVYFSSF